MDEPADQVPPHQTTVTATVTTGDVAEQGQVTGLRVDKMEAHSITINHNSSGNSDGIQSKWAIIITNALAFLAAILINVATGRLPESWEPHRWIAWPLVGIVLVGSIWYAQRQQRQTTTATLPTVPMRPEDRAAMLGTVRRIWIDGVLKDSLWNDALIELRLRNQPNSVHRPYELTFQQDGKSTDLPPGTTVQQVYEQEGRALLILGEPGSGKTTLLLELLQALLTNAEQDKNHLIPVVFNLTSWSKQQLPLEQWLTQELNNQYGVSRKQSFSWLAQGLLLPLLDGLDEVAEPLRAPCVEAINVYREAQSLSMPMVVCCRWEEYRALPQLRLSSAIRAEPLTRPQIDDFLKQAGSRLAGVRAVVKDDPSLYELLEIPLMLSITALTFADQPATVLRRTLPTEQRRTAIFDAFITRQLQPAPVGRGVDKRYGKQRTLRWLKWLAERMRERDQSVYWMEFMQENWLTTLWQVRILQNTSSIIIASIFGLIGWMVNKASQYFLKVPDSNITFVINTGIGIFLSIVVFAALRFRIMNKDIDLPERFVFNPKRLLDISIRNEFLINYISIVVFSLILGIILGFIGGMPKLGITIGLVDGVIVGFVTDLLLMAREYMPIEDRKKPNEGITRAAKNMITIGFVDGIIGALAISITVALMFAWPIGVLVGFIMVPGLCLFGPILELCSKGNAVPRHYILRFYIFLSGTFPWCITRFLDSCARRRLVQRVGGGWRFPHNLIRNHVAELDVERLIRDNKD